MRRFPHLTTASARVAGLALVALPGWGPGAPLTAQAGGGAGLPSLAEPGISPDGSLVAFVSGGDVWTVPSDGGEARLLVAHAAHESRPLWSPDGTLLAFNSDRDGSVDVHVLELATGAVTRLTWSSGTEQVNGWSRDSEWVYFSSNDEDVSGMHDVFRVRATGGTPFPVAGDRYETEFFAAPGPARSLALSTRGNMARGQWWRNGHSHIDEAEIWLVREGTGEGEPPAYRPLATGGKNLWAMWSGAGDRVFFVSDRSGAENLWSVPADADGPGRETRLTDFTDGRLLWPTAAVARPLIAFERDFGLWTHDVETGRTRALDVRLVGAVQTPAPRVREMSDDFTALAVAPDGRKVAFVARGEVFATTADSVGTAVRITDTPEAEGDLAWSPDSRRLVYTSWRGGTPRLFLHDFGAAGSEPAERALTDGSGRAETPVFSPDGASVGYARDGNELRVVDLETGTDRLLARDLGSGGSFAFSPDGRWIAWGGRTDEFTNVKVVPVTGGEARQVSFLANTNFGSLGWSPSGDYLVFRTGQRTEPGRLVKVDLVPRLPTFREDRFWDLFNQDPPGSPPAGGPDAPAPGTPATPTADDAPPAVEIDFDGIRRRGAVVDLDMSVGSVVLAPDGEHAVVSGDDGLHWASFGEDGEVDVRRLGQGAEGDGGGGGPQDLQITADGDELWYLQGGRIRAMSLPAGTLRTLATTARVEADFDREKRAVFEQAWGEMRDGFYDPGHHGADWEAVRATFAPRAAGARTSEELSRLLNLMLGELNGSHLGHSPGDGAGQPGPPVTGKLGLRFDRSSFERDGRLRVAEVIELGPAHVAGGLAPGDFLLALNGTEVGPTTSLDRLLAGTAGTKVVVRVADDAGGAGARDVELRPIPLAAERQLVYRAWVEGRRAYVDEASGGRLGYVHIPSMSEAALDQLVFDLDQENHGKEGVVVDVRNNNGGFVNVYAIDILARRNYFTMTTRGGVPAPSRVQLGQRALLAPTVLLTNQHTLSDGEDFTEGFRTLGLGPVVGEPTAGWIIYTGSAGLVDGSTVRMPRTEVRDTRGQVMELNPRPVDIPVERPAGEGYTGRDSQLDRAVETLLARLAREATSGGSPGG